MTPPKKSWTAVTRKAGGPPRIDRRQAERFPISVVFDIVEGPQSALGGQNTGALVNLSETGAAFESDAFLEPGQTLAFELPVPVKVWAKIVRVNREGVRTRYGVQFQKVKLVEKALLKRLLDKAKAGGEKL